MVQLQKPDEKRFVLFCSFHGFVDKKEKFENLKHYPLRLLFVILLLCEGVTVALKSRFSTSQFWDDCRKYNVTVIQYIGETMRYLCNTPKVCTVCRSTNFTITLKVTGNKTIMYTYVSSNFLPRQKPNDHDHKVRLAYGNGIRADVWREFIRRFGNIQIKELYGATEGNFGLVNYTSKIGAIGRQTFLYKVKAHVSFHIMK